MSDKELYETSHTGYGHKNWIPLRNNQRTFVASSNDINGSFTFEKTPILEPVGLISKLVVNPAIAQGKDGRYYLIVKGDKPGTTQLNQVIAVSDYPDRGFVIQLRPVIQDWNTEDMSMWWDEPTQKFYAVFHACTYLGMMTSSDGEKWEKAVDFEVMKKRIPLADGDTIVPDRLERPFVFIEDAKPRVFSSAVKKGNDAYIVFMPLKNH
ncbi:MAG: hypothetical protein ACK5KP_08610 [Paludibacteraceae bacterium]